MARTYGQNCSLAFALDLIGDRWTLLIIRDLLPGPKRFNRLSEDLLGMGTNLLAKRLKDLKTEGLTEQVELPAGGHSWRLTDLGRSLEPLVVSAARWGLQLYQQQFDPKNHWSPYWNYVACHARFNRKFAEQSKIDVTGRFTIDRYEYEMQIRKGELTYVEGISHRKMDFRWASTRAQFLEIVEAAERNEFSETHFLPLSGDRQKFLQCLQCFQGVQP